MLQDVFAEVAKVAELIAEDLSVLDEVAEQRVRLLEEAKKRSEEWQREITYEANLGVSVHRGVQLHKWLIFKGLQICSLLNQILKV
jgi:hypothetical protein